MLDGRALKEHTLNRLGYGQSIWHSARYDELGFDGYVEEQLAGSLPGLAPAPDPIDQTTDAVAAKLAAAVAERRQLEAVLADFWFNHFNVQVANGADRRRLPFYLNQVIAPGVLGSFGGLLLGTAQAPAMLDYLDNASNAAEDPARNQGLNENYARELMELHTLGVDQGYSETDIIEVARILTGWGIANEAYIFRANRHDQGQKVAMGVTYAAGRGEDEGIELLAWLAGRPATARRVAGKLCGRLVSEAPPATVVDAAAGAFSSSGGDLRATTRAILTSPDFRADGALRAKVKPPLRYLASAVMAMGAATMGDVGGLTDELVSTISDLGEDPYQVGPPTGYPEASPYWVSASSMLGRFDVAGAIATEPALLASLKTAAGTDGADPGPTVDAVIARLCPAGVSAVTRQAALDHVTSHATSNDQRVADAAHVILSSPEFGRF